MDIPRLVAEWARERLQHLPAVALLGPRQVGKTTLAKQLQSQLGQATLYLDLESPADLNRLADPEAYLLARPDRLIVIDEVQRMPELFPVLRSVIDRQRTNGRFLLLGSASPALLAQSSETLAGRVAYLEVHPFVYDEVAGHCSVEQLWVRGGLPPMLLAATDQASFANRVDFVQTYLERELPLLGLAAPPARLRALVRMLAHVHGGLLNYSDLARSLGVDQGTVKHHIDYLEHAFLVRRLPPYHANLGKRLVKSPKLYLRDTGLLHAVAGVENLEELEGYPGKGLSWEGLVVQQVAALARPSVELTFYRTQDGAELDLVLLKGASPVLGLEVKYASNPKLARGTTVAAQDLGGLPVLVVTPAAPEDYPLNAQTTVTSLGRLAAHLRQRGLA
jgi:uncharacterized protein